ncbi:unnamed protein product [Pleuronectes platessa]|uniref:Uncharacterized protein n=1 Tax=Pleuronectes platessa TaxID=8262 RepID=A0A9N7VH78_PLEPL|nr:unnamed protein product [Pleuronectes platessa]
MEPTERFFSRIRKLAVTLESETTKLQKSFDNRDNNEVDSETTAKAMRAYHELNCDVGNLKGQVQDQLTQQQAQENEVSSFIKACRVMEQRVSQDIQTLKEHFENYGYEAPRDAQRLTKHNHQTQILKKWQMKVKVIQQEKKMQARRRLEMIRPHHL